MAIDVAPGQFCIIGSRYSEGYRVIRADKVTPKQIRTLRWGNSYDQTSRDLVLFAGSEDAAKALSDKLNLAAESYRKNTSAAEAEYREKCEPFKAARDAQSLTFRADYLAQRDALIAEQVSA